MNRHPFLLALAACLSSLVLGSAAENAAPNEFFTYFGTYTGAKSKGIYVSRFDAATGKATAPALAAETASPSFLAVHPNRKFLYAAGEISNFQGKKAGGVSAFAIQPDGTLRLLNQVSSVDAGPCHLTVDKSGACVLVANYGGGSVAALAIKPDGSLAEAGAGGFVQHAGRSVTPRQSQPNAHSINVAPDNRFAFCADLGLDKVLAYKLDAAKAALTANEPAFTAATPGSGPRHFAFHPSGRFAYVINEINCTMTAFAYDAAKGALTAFQTLSTLPAGMEVQKGFSTAEVVAHPSGKFLYGSNRGHDTIAVFSVAADGRLALVQNAPTLGKTPRNFNVDPTGRWLLAANQGSDSVVLFRIDPQTGKLTPTGDSLAVGSPVCVRFVSVK